MVPQSTGERGGPGQPALGSFKDGRASAELEKLLLTDESPYVQCEAPGSLTKCGHEPAMEVLKKALEFESPNSTLMEACLEWMGRLQGEEVDRIVIGNLGYGRPTRARIGALKAIKERGRIHEDEFQAVKEIILLDKELRG